MSILGFILLVFAVVLVMWAVNTQLQMPATLKAVLNIGVAVLLVLWLILLMFPQVMNYRIGR